MLILLAIGAYSLVGGLLMGALLTDNHTNTCTTDAICCVIAGFIWPIAIGTAGGFALVDNIKEKRAAKEKERNDHILRFLSKLLKLQLISPETYYNARKTLNDR